MSLKKASETLGQELAALRGNRWSRAELADLLKRECQGIGSVDQSTIAKWEKNEGARERIELSVSFLRHRLAEGQKLRITFPEGPEGLLLRLILTEPTEVGPEWVAELNRLQIRDFGVADSGTFNTVKIGWQARELLREGDADVAIYAEGLPSDAAETTPLLRLCTLCEMPAASLVLDNYDAGKFAAHFKEARIGVPINSVFSEVVNKFARMHLLPEPGERMVKLLEIEKAVEAMKSRKIDWLVGPPNYVAKVHLELIAKNVKVDTPPIAFFGSAAFGLYISQTAAFSPKVSVLRNTLRRLMAASAALHALPNFAEGVPGCVEHVIDWPSGLYDNANRALQIHYAGRSRHGVTNLDANFLLQLWEHEVLTSQQTPSIKQ